MSRLGCLPHSAQGTGIVEGLLAISTNRQTVLISTVCVIEKGISSGSARLESEDTRLRLCPTENIFLLAFHDLGPAAGLISNPSRPMQEFLAVFHLVCH